MSVVSSAECAVLAMFGVLPVGYSEMPRGGRCALYDAEKARPILARYIQAKDTAVQKLGRP
jgi:hypothetical protein